ncbi:hypothetical protein BGW36DRAFT_387047 [Talaromyces proteolyticus]|uniref:NAD-dependent epimerase/dehydratase domain-containing protein n=1 Tax=Talaromyces proteolyticus TaxID=1131652 RepID=A0AAD4PUE5_9EURO|nr:uncharacterized protein BGW36DRAFT_387047 [Talaromyces proteolyticus]KAH8692125.1 hypothetical protein BGW36DRAFT_387047 [Talaromyces proteolyticus]
MSRIFITGVTGYIGGDVLYGLTKAQAASSIVALVRNEAQAAFIAEQYPAVKPLIGNLDSVSEIEEQASQADVVLHLASSNHVPSAKAIAEGLSKTQRVNPVWIQISGASLLSGPEIAANTYGENNSKIFNDLEGVGELREIIASPARVVDQIVTNLSSSQPNVRTAILYGPLIYGQGRGPVNQRSMQIPDLAKAILQHGHGIQVGKGSSTWSHIHISDITRLLVMLVLEASRNTNQLLWNENGIYFANAGLLSFGEISNKMSDFAYSRGLISSPSTKEIQPKIADLLTHRGAVLWGTNARTSSDRARKILQWQPEGPSIEEEIPRAILAEAAFFQRPTFHV